jgi:hypothetical protein
MRHFDVLISTHLYEKMDSESKQNLRAAWDMVASDCSGLGFNTLPVNEINDDHIKVATNNIIANYDRFRYMQTEIEIVFDYLEVPKDRFEFFKNVMNLYARTVLLIAKVW